MHILSIYTDLHDIWLSILLHVLHVCPFASLWCVWGGYNACVVKVRGGSMVGVRSKYRE